MAKPKRDLFDNPDKVKSVFDKERNRWTVDDYRSAMVDRENQGLRNFTYGMLIRHMVETPAFLSLTPRATKLYLACVNATWVDQAATNKRLGCKPRDVGDKYAHEDRPALVTDPFCCPYNYAKAFGVGSDRQISAAFRELKAFRVIEQIGVARRNYPNVYKHVQGFKELTWDDCREIKLALK